MIRLAVNQNISVILLGAPRPEIFLSSADLYEEIAESTGALLIEDLIPDILGNNSLQSDAAHPNKEGYRMIAERITETLEYAGAI